MWRTRLRPEWPAEALAEIYAVPDVPFGHPDHVLRIPVTAQMAQWLIELHGLGTAADLSCGNGLCLNMIRLPKNAKFYGDYAPGAGLCGPVEETVHQIPKVDVFICGETIEHLDDPDAFLADLRERTRFAVISTPVAFSGRTPEEYETLAFNAAPGHYWAWDREAVQDMFAKAGFSVETYAELDFGGFRRPAWETDMLPHDFGIWALR